MASAINKLSAAKVAKPTKPGLYGDGGGLYLQISKWGTRAWIFRFALDGRSRYMGLGSVATFGLAEAREKARACRQLVHEGIDPIEQRRGRRAATRIEAAKRMTFREAARSYVSTHRAGWSEGHASQWTSSLEQHVYPEIGDLDVAAIDTEAVRRVVEPLWATRTVTADRIRNRIEATLDWAAARHLRSGDNPARWRGHLSKLLPAPSKIAKKQHLAALAYGDLPPFMERLRGIDGVACRALEFLILTAARSAEVLGATWGEIDLDKAVWTIPAERMKAKREHRIPLTGRALAILRGMQGAGGTFVFPRRGKDQPLPARSLIDALRGMDGHGVTVHGFRSAFRDWAGDATQFPREVAEAALAHAVGDATESAYRRGDALEKRRLLMDAWAGFCASPAVEPGGKVLPMKRPS